MYVYICVCANAYVCDGQRSTCRVNSLYPYMSSRTTLRSSGMCRVHLYCCAISPNCVCLFIVKCKNIKLSWNNSNDRACRILKICLILVIKISEYITNINFIFYRCLLIMVERKRIYMGLSMNTHM